MNRMWLDDKLIVDDNKLHDPNSQTVNLQLTKGKRYPIKIELGLGGFGTRLVWLPLSADPSFEAASAARQADVVVAVVGITSKLEGEEMKVDVPGFRGGDRTSLALPAEEEALLGALKGSGQATGRRADERQRAGGELGERPRQCDPRRVVFGRRGWNGNRRRPWPG